MSLSPKQMLVLAILLFIVIGLVGCAVLIVTERFIPF